MVNDSKELNCLTKMMDAEPTIKVASKVNFKAFYFFNSQY